MNYYKGRTSFIETLNLPMYMFHTWFHLAQEAEKTPEGQKAKEAEAIQEVLEGR